jgi:hypothetical protein
VGALTKKDVGEYLNKYFESSYQKISNFTVTAGGQKQGGNVASYFCTSQGRVLHVVAGPVSGAKLLDEARWVEETWKIADLYELKTVAQIQSLFRKAHVERLASEFSIHLQPRYLPALESPLATSLIGGPSVAGLLNRTQDKQAKVQLLLASYPLPKIARVYTTVFETILEQKISTTPVIKG